MNKENCVSNNSENLGKEINIMNEDYRILNIKDLKARYRIGNDAAYAFVRQKDFPSFLLKGRFITREDKLLEWEEKHMSAPKKYM